MCIIVFVFVSFPCYSMLIGNNIVGGMLMSLNNISYTILMKVSVFFFFLDVDLLFLYFIEKLLIWNQVFLVLLRKNSQHFQTMGIVFTKGRITLCQLPQKAFLFRFKFRVNATAVALPVCKRVPESEVTRFSDCAGVHIMQKSNRLQ